jgi:hypothetical protein
MTPEVWIGIAALCFSIIGSAWWLGRELGEIKTRLTIIDQHMTQGSIKMDELDHRVDDHGERLVRLETRSFA